MTLPMAAFVRQRKGKNFFNFALEAEMAIPISLH
jgi:hypothetical protein